MGDDAPVSALVGADDDDDTDAGTPKLKPPVELTDGDGAATTPVPVEDAGGEPKPNDGVDDAGAAAPNVKPVAGAAAAAETAVDDAGAGAPNVKPPIPIEPVPTETDTGAEPDTTGEEPDTLALCTSLSNTFDGALDSHAAHLPALHGFTMRQFTHFQLTPSSA